MHYQLGHGIPAVVYDTAIGHTLPKTPTTALEVSSSLKHYFCWLLCDNLIKIFLFISSNNFPYSCLLVLLLITSMQFNPYDSLSVLWKSCLHVCMSPLEKPSTLPGSRSPHDWIMKPIHHNKNLLSADVSVAVDILVENIFPQNHRNSYGLRCFHHFVSLWIYNCGLLSFPNCWDFG